MMSKELMMKNDVVLTVRKIEEFGIKQYAEFRKSRMFNKTLKLADPRRINFQHLRCQTQTVNEQSQDQKS